MLDLHTHILPGLDDGPATMAEALALLDALVADGVQHVVATPHIYPGVFDNTFEGIEQAFDTLRREAAARELPLTMSWAAEVRLCAEMLEWHDESRLPLYGGGAAQQPAVLLELPDGTIPLRADRLVGKLVSLGLQPVIAHPERNRAVMDDVDRIDTLRRQGAKLQLTAGSLLGEFGERAAAAAHEMLRRGWVDVVASDAHNLRARRPRMQAARDWLVRHHGAALAEQLTETGPSLLAGVGAIAVESPSGWALRDLPATVSAADAVRVDLAGRVQGIADTAPRRPATSGAFELTDWHASASAHVAAVNVSAEGLHAVEVVPLRRTSDLPEPPAAVEGGADVERMRLDLREFELPRPTTRPSMDIDDLSFATPLQACETFDMARRGEVIDLEPAAVEPMESPASPAAPTEPRATAARVEVAQASVLPDAAAAVSVPPVIQDEAAPLRASVGARVTVMQQTAPVAPAAPTVSPAFDVMAELQRARALNLRPRGQRPPSIGFVPAGTGAGQADSSMDPEPPAGARRTG